MGLRQDDYELLLKQQFTVQIHLIDRRTQKANINFALMEKVILDRRENVLALDIDGWKAPAVLRHRLPSESPQPGGNPDSDAPRFSLLRVAGRFGRPSGLHHQLSGLVQKYLSRPG